MTSAWHRQQPDIFSGLVVVCGTRAVSATPWHSYQKLRQPVKPPPVNASNDTCWAPVPACDTYLMPTAYKNLLPATLMACGTCHSPGLSCDPCPVRRPHCDTCLCLHQPVTLTVCIYLDVISRVVCTHLALCPSCRRHSGKGSHEERRHGM